MESIVVYRYCIALHKMYRWVVKITKETPCFYMNACTRIKKEDYGYPIFKDRTSYPYVDFYSTKDTSREYAIRNILEMFKRDMI